MLRLKKLALFALRAPRGFEEETTSKPRFGSPLLRKYLGHNVEIPASSWNYPEGDMSPRINAKIERPQHRDFSEQAQRMGAHGLTEIRHSTGSTEL